MKSQWSGKWLLEISGSAVLWFKLKLPDATRRGGRWRGLGQTWSIKRKRQDDYFNCFAVGMFVSSLLLFIGSRGLQKKKSKCLSRPYQGLEKVNSTNSHGDLTLCRGTLNPLGMS